MENKVIDAADRFNSGSVEATVVAFQKYPKKIKQVVIMFVDEDNCFEAYVSDGWKLTTLGLVEACKAVMVENFFFDRNL